MVVSVDCGGPVGTVIGGGKGEEVDTRSDMEVELLAGRLV